MKASSVLASFFLSSLAAAAPVNKRDYLTKTSVVMETVYITTTIWDDGEGAPATAAAGATSTPGLFYEQHPTPSAPAQQPAPSSKAPAVPSPSSVYTPPAVSAPAYTPPAVSTPAYTPPAVSTPAYTPPAVSTPAYTPPAPSVVQPQPSSVAPQQPSSAQPSQPAQTGGSTGGSGTGQYSGDITIYDNSGADGACGKPVNDGDLTVALAQPAFGASTYNYMTGAATNKWCGQKVRIFYKGNSVDATIMDVCPGCKGDDLDLTMAVWTKLTGTSEKTRYQATWSTI